MATTKATTLAHGQAGLIVSGTLADARIPNLATSKITSGTFADARIASSNVTQHEGSIDALGTVASGTFNGIIGSSSTQATDRIIKHHAFTAQLNNYTNTTGNWLTTGNGWSGTTSSQTSKLIVFATGQNMSYFASGASLPNGGVKLVYHSDATTQGASPSGSDLGSQTNSGGYSVGLASGRKDLYLSWALYVTVSVSASTAYSIQVASKLHDGNYFHLESRTTGFVMEVK